MTDKIYLPMLEDVCEKIDTYSITSKDYPYGIHVPYAMSEVCDIYWIGVDPYYWQPFNSMMDAYHRGCLKDYLELNESTVDLQYLRHHNETNNAGTFWSAVQKSHLLIKTGDYVDDLSKLSDTQYDAISTIGYCNFYCVERSSTLKKEDSTWVNTANTTRLRRISAGISSVKKILDAYHPKTVFVLHWTENMSRVRELSLKAYPEYYQEGVISVFKILDYEARLVWAAHPRSLKMKGYSDHDIALLFQQAASAELD